MTNKLQNKINELIELEKLYNIKQQYEQHLKTKGLYEQFDFVPLPQEIMDECNTDWQNESENDLENALDHKINKWGL